MIAALLLATVAPPPIIVRSPPPVMNAVSPPIFRESRRELLNRKASFDVDIRAGGQELWSGPMRVSGGVPASLGRQKSDAPAGDCVPVERYSYKSGRSSLSVTLNMNALEGDKAGFSLSISWERPVEVSGCGGQDGNRSIGLAQSFTLEPGQETSFSGDGGLTVRLKRRD